MRFFSSPPARASIGGMFDSIGPTPIKPPFKIPSSAWGHACYREAEDRWSFFHSVYTPPASFGDWVSALNLAGEKIAGRKADDKKKEEAAVAIASALGGPQAGAFFAKYVIPIAKAILGSNPSEEAHKEAMACFDELAKRGLPLWPFFGGATHPNILKALYCERRDIFNRKDIDGQPLIDLWADLLVTIKQKSVSWMASVQWPFGLAHVEGSFDAFPASGKGVRNYWVPSFTAVISGFAVVEAAVRGLPPEAAAGIAANSIVTFYTKYASFDIVKSKSIVDRKIPSFFDETVLKSGPGRMSDPLGWSQYLHATAAKVVQETPSGSSGASGSGSSGGIGLGTLAALGGVGYLGVKYGPAIAMSLFNGRPKR